MKQNDNQRFHKFAMFNCWMLVFPCFRFSATVSKCHFLSSLTPVSDYVIMMCIICHVDILCLSIRYNRLIWFFSFFSLGTMQKQNDQKTFVKMFCKMSWICLQNLKPFRFIYAGIKCILPLSTTNNKIKVMIPNIRKTPAIETKM